MKGCAAALSLALLVLSCFEGLAAAQEQPPPWTTFKSAVDLVPVDVNVVDKNGRPVKDLAADDFTLAVDGKPRRITSAQFIAVDRASESAPPKAMEYASNAGAQAGRLVMIAVDSGNIGVGRGKQAIKAAKRFVGTLNRNDRVALVTLPGAGPQIEFTSNHAIVQTLLGNVVGQAADNIGQKRIGLAEALAIDRNDRLVINDITNRECASNSTPDMLASCLLQLSAESRQMIAQVKRRTNNALISLRYLFERMATTVNGRKVGQVVRPFRITRAAAAVSTPGGATVLMRPAAPIPFVSRIDAFDKSSVLTPQVVGFFLDRMSAAAVSNAAAVRPAIDSARAGRFDQTMQSLENVPDNQLAAVFVKGLALLATGSRADLDAAADKFRAALRLDSEFLPAAFYLGACYAAGGKDRDAAGAWQTSLITESSAPFVYTLLGDALLRLKDVDQAIDILIEARTLWPADDQVAMRLGAALVMANKPAEALQILLPYLAKHPSDHERIFLVLRALYEARSAGRPIATVEADRSLFMRYADAYMAANGPQQSLVAQWRKYAEK